MELQLLLGVSTVFSCIEPPCDTSSRNSCTSRLTCWAGWILVVTVVEVVEVVGLVVVQALGGCFAYPPPL